MFFASNVFGCQTLRNVPQIPREAPEFRQLANEAFLSTLQWMCRLDVQSDEFACFIFIKARDAHVRVLGRSCSCE